jgi:hypothetical protein
MSGTCLFLATSSPLMASSEAFSSNIECDFLRHLDGIQSETRMRAVEADQFDQLITRKTRGTISAVLTATERESVVETGPDAASLKSTGWFELRNYEEIRNERHDLYQNANAVVRAAVKPAPVLPDPGSSFALSETIVAGSPARLSSLSPVTQTATPRLFQYQDNGVRLSAAAVNPVRRDYFSFRNGYCGGDSYSSLNSQSFLTTHLKILCSHSFASLREALSSSFIFSAIGFKITTAPVAIVKCTAIAERSHLRSLFGDNV